MNKEQIEQLSAPLSRENVKVRSQAGRNLSYIESWVAIKEANRIFGFDGWCRETIEMRMVSESARKVGKAQDAGWGVSYVGRVRVTVGDIVREGFGAGHGIDRDLGLAHESAIKECESDAAKRALMTFGNPFGLALYDKEQSEVEDAPRAPASNPTSIPDQTADADGQVTAWLERQKDIITACKDLDEMEVWLAKNANYADKVGGWEKPASSSALDKMKRKMPKMFEDLHDYYIEKLHQV